MNPADIKSGMWTDPRGYLCRLSAATPTAYRQLCQAKLVQGWHPAESYPVDGVVLMHLDNPPQMHVQPVIRASVSSAKTYVAEVDKATGEISGLVERASEAVTVPIKRSRK